MNHYSQLQLAIDRCIQTLKKIKPGKEIKFISKNELKLMSDVFLDLPFIISLDGDSSTFEEFKVIAIKKSQSNIITVIGKSLNGETGKNIEEFSIEDLEASNLAFIADMVESRL